MLLTLISHANADIEQSRINRIISAFDTNYLELSKNVPADSEYLFGDDITKRISIINTNNKLIQGKYYNRSFSQTLETVPCKTLGTTTARGSNQANTARGPYKTRGPQKSSKNYRTQKKK